MFGRQVRYVDVQAQRASEVFGHGFSHDRQDVLLHGAEVGVLVVVEQREADRRNVVETAFDGGSHRSGIEDVNGRVGAVVDA